MVWVDTYSHVCVALLLPHLHNISFLRTHHLASWLTLYLLTNFIKQRPFLRSRQLFTYSRTSNIVWKLKIHYLIHKSPPLVPILRQTATYHPILFLYIYILIRLLYEQYVGKYIYIIFIVNKLAAAFRLTRVSLSAGHCYGGQHRKCSNYVRFYRSVTWCLQSGKGKMEEIPGV
jgi:hypothetical protein